MFTKDDFLHYFNQLRRIETEMRKTYQRLHHEIEHPKYKKLFGKLARQEAGHMALVKKLKDLFAR